MATTSLRNSLYLPGSEVDTEEPMLVYEHNGGRGADIGMERALEIIRKTAQINHTSCIRKEYDGIIDKAIKKECEKSSIFSHSFAVISPNRNASFITVPMSSGISESWSYVFSSRAGTPHGFEVA